MSFTSRLVNLLRGERLSADIDRELAFHLAERTDELAAQGLSRADAEREARRRFGHRTGLVERTREVDILGWLESLLQDFRYALRALRRNPLFAAVAVGSLALGIGANTAIFTLLNAVVIRTLPVAEPQQLFGVSSEQPREGLRIGRSTFTNPIWEALRDGAHGVAGLFAYGGASFDLGRGGELRPIDAEYVSGGYFRILGVGPAAGRVLVDADDARGCAPVAVLGYNFAGHTFGSPAAAVGKSISLDGHSVPVVGVAAEGFTGVEVGTASQVYIPICTQPMLNGGTSALDHRSYWWLNIMGRTAPGRSIAATSARIAQLAPEVYAATLPPNRDADGQRRYLASVLRAVPAAAGASTVRSRYGQTLAILLALVGAVLLVACANVAHLLLARATARSREMAVRLAIGAGRRRLVRQLLTESLTLAGAGAVLGLLFARWAGALLVRYVSTRSDAIWLDLAPDGRVLAFTAGIAVLTGILFGLVPAWRATRVEPQAAMKAQGRGNAPGRTSLARVLVTGQIALSLVLVTTAGLLVGTFRRLATIDPGFQQDGVLLATVHFDNTSADSATRAAIRDRVLDRLRALPGIRSAATSMYAPPTGGSGWNEHIAVEGDSGAADDAHLVWFNSVSAHWFETMGTPLLAGRDFTTADGPGAPQVVIVNDAFVRHQLGGRNPIGVEIRVRGNDGVDEPPMTIVGVARDAKYRNLDESPTQTAYRPMTQGPWWNPAAVYELRAAGEPVLLESAVTAAITAEHPAATVEYGTLDQQVSETLRRPRLLATLSGFFGGLALLLAVIGLYGTMAYGVARRRLEIGIRLALGAARAHVWLGVLKDAGIVIAAGAALGLAGAYAASRLIEAFLYGLEPHDPAVFALSALLLAAVGMAACAIPAWRAASVDPAETLRAD